MALVLCSASEDARALGSVVGGCAKDATDGIAVGNVAARLFTRSRPTPARSDVWMVCLA